MTASDQSLIMGVFEHAEGNIILSISPPGRGSCRKPVSSGERRPHDRVQTYKIQWFTQAEPQEKVQISKVILKGE